MKGAVRKGRPVANTDLLSFSIRAKDDKTKSVPVYFGSGMTLANIQAGATALAPLIDAVTDGVIDSIQVTLSLTVPGGIKTQPTNGNVAREGGLLTFDCTGTKYGDSLWIPAFVETLISGNDIPNADAVDALQGGLIGGVGTGGALLVASDKFGNVYNTYKRGKRAFRK